MSKFILFLLSLTIYLSAGQTVFEGKFILFFKFSNPQVTDCMCFTEQPMKQFTSLIGKHHKNINRRCFPENMWNLSQQLFQRASNFSVTYWRSPEISAFSNTLLIFVTKLLINLLRFESESQISILFKKISKISIHMQINKFHDFLLYKKFMICAENCLENLKEIHFQKSLLFKIFIIRLTVYLQEVSLKIYQKVWHFLRRLFLLSKHVQKCK